MVRKRFLSKNNNAQNNSHNQKMTQIFQQSIFCKNFIICIQKKTKENGEKNCRKYGFLWSLLLIDLFISHMSVLLLSACRVCASYNLRCRICATFMNLVDLGICLNKPSIISLGTPIFCNPSRMKMLIYFVLHEHYIFLLACV